MKTASKYHSREHYFSLDQEPKLLNQMKSMDEKFTKGTNLECLEGPATVQQQEKSMEG
jgi:hypothetical protein